MSSEPITIDKLVGDVTFILLNHDGFDPNTDGQVRSALDAVLQDMVARTQFAAFKKYDTFTVTSGTHTYPCPEDFVQFLSYGIQCQSPFRTLDWISERQFLEGEMERNQQSGDPVRFFYTHKDEDDGLWRFRVHPTPSSTLVYNRCYLSMPKSIRLTVPGGDHVLDPRFPTQHIRGLVCGAATHFPQYLDQATLSINAQHMMKAVDAMSQKSEPIAGQLLQKAAYGSHLRYGGLPPTVTVRSIR